MPLDDALRDAAERNGVQQEFWDIFGRRHFTEPETNRAILTALGLDCASEDLCAPRSPRAKRRNRPLLPPVLVMSENESAAFPGIWISKSSPNRAKRIASACENGVARSRLEIAARISRGALGRLHHEADRHAGSRLSARARQARRTRHDPLRSAFATATGDAAISAICAI